MHNRKLLWFLLLIVLLMVNVDARRRGGKKGSSSRMRTGIFITSRHPASQAYYNNKNATKIIDWSHFESEYTLGRKIVFMCTATGNPRPNIIWFKNGIELYAHSFFQVHEWILDEETLKSKMEIDPATQMDAGYYECQADNMYAVDVKGFRTDYSIVFE